VTPQVSILMSVCGTSQWLAEAVLSVVTCGVDFELLIRANGVKEYKPWERIGQHVPQGRVTTFFTHPIMGLADSLNGMLEFAQAPYVMRLDPDDVLPPGTLPEMLEAAYSAGAGPVVYGDYVDFGERSGLIRAREATPQALSWHNVAPYNYLAPTWLFRKVGGWQEVGYEDWDLLVRMLAAGGQPVMIPRVILYHRVRSDGRLAAQMADHDAHVLGIRERSREWFERAP
jgi:GT2 family glycosyltransferase